MLSFHFSSIHTNLPAAVQNSEKKTPLYCHLLVCVVFSRSTYAHCSTPQLWRKLTSSGICAKLNPHEYFTLEYRSEKHAHELNPSFKQSRNEAALKTRHQPAQRKSITQFILLLSIPKKKYSNWAAALTSSVGGELPECSSSTEIRPSELVQQQILWNRHEKVSPKKKKKPPISRIPQSGNVSDNAVWLFLSSISGRERESAREPDKRWARQNNKRRRRLPNTILQIEFEVWHGEKSGVLVTMGRRAGRRGCES